MPRQTRAAQRLLTDAQGVRHSAKAQPYGDPDGLGVYRTLKFDKRTSEWLAPLLERIDDARIQDLNLTEAGYLHVTFVPDPRADYRDPFPLRDAEEVLRSEAAGSGAAQGEGHPDPSGASE